MPPVEERRGGRRGRDRRARANGDRTRSTPGDRGRAAAVAAVAAPRRRRVGEVRARRPAGSASSRAGRRAARRQVLAGARLAGHVGAPECRRWNSDSPVTPPTATAKRQRPRRPATPRSPQRARRPTNEPRRVHRGGVGGAVPRRSVVCTRDSLPAVSTAQDDDLFAASRGRTPDRRRRTSGRRPSRRSPCGCGPRSLEEVRGQADVLRPGSPLRRLIEGSGGAAGPLSAIIWGPPGTGKTTLAHLVATAADRRFVELSAVTAGVKDVREVMDQAARERDLYDRQTVLFLDEIHRFTKAQQDALLPGRGEPARSSSSRPPPRTRRSASSPRCCPARCSITLGPARRRRDRRRARRRRDRRARAGGRASPSPTTPARTSSGSPAVTPGAR